jgi:molybdopterin-dependent oxidoreductase alpha subunit
VVKKGLAGGGFPAIRYTISKAFEVGPLRLWAKMTSKNACKTCALGMGGQKGGMVNEAGHFPEVCKKSLQAQVADMKGAILPEFFEKNSIFVLEKLTPKQAEDLGRISFPVMLEEGGSHFKAITWEAAMYYLEAALKSSSSERTAFYSSGRSSNEAAFILQSFARVYGSNNVMNCSYYCHQASGVALKLSIGTGTATIDLDDLKKCDLVVLVGANPASNHPRLMTLLAELRERGGKVIVINPLREAGLERFYVPSRPLSLLMGSQIASSYIQPYAGGDLALFVGAIKALIDEELLNLEWIEKYTEGSSAIIEDAKDASWEQITASSGVSESEIRDLARAVAGSKACIFAWAMGLTHHTWGVDNILAMTNLALLTGQIGKPGAGLLPIRGHSNVQGIGSIGFSPSISEGIRKSLERIYGKELPVEPGYDTHALIEAAGEGNIDCLFALGGNLWGSNPNSTWATKCMQQIGTTVYLSTKLNPGHFHGRAKRTLILPVLARDEEQQATTQESMFNFVRLSSGGEANIEGQMRSESEIIVELADRLLGRSPFDWSKLRDHTEVRRIIAACIPGFEPIEKIETGNEFTIGGRVFHKPDFPTSNGKALMHRTPLPPPPKPDEFRLITLRSEGQFNSVVYEEHDLYRGVTNRYSVIISAEDARRLDLLDGDRVTVYGEAGQMDDVEVFVSDIRPGVAAMYYPEANVLIKARVDERSRTPAFKSAPIRISKITKKNR